MAYQVHTRDLESGRLKGYLKRERFSTDIMRDAFIASYDINAIFHSNNLTSSTMTALLLNTKLFFLPFDTVYSVWLNAVQCICIFTVILMTLVQCIFTAKVSEILSSSKNTILEQHCNDILTLPYQSTFCL